MKAKLSNYLQDEKKNLKHIVKELSKEFKYVSILGTDTIGTTYRVS